MDGCVDAITKPHELEAKRTARILVTTTRRRKLQDDTRGPLPGYDNERRASYEAKRGAIFELEAKRTAQLPGHDDEDAESCKTIRAYHYLAAVAR